MKTGLINEQSASYFDKHGVFIQPAFLSAAEVDYLKTEFERITANAGLPQGFYTSTDLKDTEARAQIRNLINQVVNQQKVDTWLKGYKLFYSNLLYKKPAADSAMILHSDWSITDELQYTPMQIWIPLVDVNPENGTLAALLGSHKLTLPYRGYGVDEYYMEYQPGLMDQLTYFTVNKGDAVFYHPGILHYSPPNKSATPRLAMLVSLYPAAMEPVLYYQTKSIFGNKVNMYKLPPGFFDSWNKKDKPNLELARKVQNPKGKLSLESFKAQLIVSHE